MRKLISLVAGLVLCSVCAFAGLAPGATISLLTSEPCNNAVFTAWGHSAIRVCSPADGIDRVYNYGVFSFGDLSVFLVKFVKGETDYRLGVTSFDNAYGEAAFEKNVNFYEQVIDLTDEEKDKVYEALKLNYKKENRYYRYNFFYDNCATRPRDIFEKQIDGSIVYPEVNNTMTYRDLIHEYLQKMPWFTFGIDICLGSETDAVVTDCNLQFLPNYLMEAYAKTGVQRGDSLRPLVLETKVLNERRPVPEEKGFADYLTPMLVCWIFFVLIVAHTIYYSKTKKPDNFLDAPLFFLYGLVGSLVFFLMFFSEHPCTYPNCNILWLNPLQLLAAALILFRKQSKAAYYVVAAVGVMALAAILGWPLFTQQFHPAFLPLMLVLAVRCANFVLVRRKNL